MPRPRPQVQARGPAPAPAPRHSPAEDAASSHPPPAPATAAASVPGPSKPSPLSSPGPGLCSSQSGKDRDPLTLRRRDCPHRGPALTRQVQPAGDLPVESRRAHAGARASCRALCRPPRPAPRLQLSPFCAIKLFVPHALVPQCYLPGERRGAGRGCGGHTGRWPLRSGAPSCPVASGRRLGCEGRGGPSRGAREVCDFSSTGP